MKNLLGCLYLLTTGIGQAIIVVFILALIFPEWCMGFFAGILVILIFALIIKLIVDIFSVFK